MNGAHAPATRSTRAPRPEVVAASLAAARTCDRKTDAPHQEVEQEQRDRRQHEAIPQRTVGNDLLPRGVEDAAWPRIDGTTSGQRGARQALEIGIEARVLAGVRVRHVAIADGERLQLAVFARLGVLGPQQE